jgi:hypothetical protein
LRILFDNNVPVGVRAFLPRHEVRTILEMNWSPRIKNGELLNATEAATFDVLVTSDQNIPQQQNLVGRRLALVVLSSNIWNVVRNHGVAIAAAVDVVSPGSCETVVMPIPPKPHKPSGAR